MLYEVQHTERVGLRQAIAIAILSSLDYKTDCLACSKPYCAQRRIVRYCLNYRLSNTFYLVGYDLQRYSGQSVYWHAIGGSVYSVLGLAIPAKTSDKALSSFCTLSPTKYIFSGLQNLFRTSVPLLDIRSSI